MLDRIVFAVAPALALLVGASAQAAPIPVHNAGFEEPYLGSNLPLFYSGDVPPGAFPTGPTPSGWDPYYATGNPVAGQFLGVLNPGTTADYAPSGAMPCFPSGAPEGDNVALAFTSGGAGGTEYGITQPLGVPLEPDTLYTITVEVGNIQSCEGLVPPFTSFFNLDGFPGYRVQLLAGGILVAEETDSLRPGEGLFETTTFQLTTQTGSVGLGQELEIRLINRNNPDQPGAGNLEVDFDDVRIDATPAPPVPISSLTRFLLVGFLLASGGAPQGARGRSRR